MSTRSVDRRERFFVLELDVSAFGEFVCNVTRGGFEGPFDSLLVELRQLSKLPAPQPE